jgi:hypothetical protein
VAPERLRGGCVAPESLRNITLNHLFAQNLHFPNTKACKEEYCMQYNPANYRIYQIF